MEPKCLRACADAGHTCTHLHAYDCADAGHTHTHLHIHDCADAGHTHTHTPVTGQVKPQEGIPHLEHWKPSGRPAPPQPTPALQ